MTSRVQPEVPSRRGACVLAVMLFCSPLSPPASAALIDADPANDDPATTPTFVTRVATLVAETGSLVLDERPACVDLVRCDVDFVRLLGLREGDFVAAYTSVHSALGGGAPELLLGVLDPDLLPVALGPSTDTSARLGFVVPEAGDFVLGITGAFDDLLLGNHFETGSYHVSLAVFPSPRSGETLADAEPANDSRATTPVAVARGDATAIFAGSFELGTPPGCSGAGGTCDVDFVRVNGLLGGDLVTIATFLPGAPGGAEAIGPDTLVGVFDAAGVLVASEGDFQAASLFDFEVPASGDYWVAVTGTFDGAFTGDHSEFGSYQLALTIHPTPEAAGALGGAAAAASLAGLARRRRSG